MCTACQLSEAHELWFLMEMVKTLYLLLKTAFNTGKPYRTMETWRKGRVTDPQVALPAPATLIAVTHVAGTCTAHMASVLTKERRGLPLLNAAVKLQIEQFPYHVIQWSDKHQTILGHRPPEQTMPEWLLKQVCTDAELFAAKQLDSKISDPTSEQRIAFIHRQRDLLAERRGVAKGAAKHGRQEERLLLVTNKAASGSDRNSSSDDKTGTPVDTATVLDIYGNPQFNKGVKGAAPTYRRAWFCTR
jgi:hypothetical protein